MNGSSDLNPNINHEYLNGFDVVVGSYSKNGKQIDEPIVLNPAKKTKIAEMYARSAALGGASLLPTVTTNTKPAKKQRAKQTKLVTPTIDVESLLPVVNESSYTHSTLETQFVKPVTEIPKMFVYLHNQMGRIKMAVEAVLDSEMAYCLVFTNEDQVIFIPNAGETLKFTNHKGDTADVYYADTLFNWTDGMKKLMILFKADKNE